MSISRQTWPSEPWPLPSAPVADPPCPSSLPLRGPSRLFRSWTHGTRRHAFVCVCVEYVPSNISVSYCPFGDLLSNVAKLNFNWVSICLFPLKNKSTVWLCLFTLHSLLIFSPSAFFVFVSLRKCQSFTVCYTFLWQLELAAWMTCKRNYFTDFEERVKRAKCGNESEGNFPLTPELILPSPTPICRFSHFLWHTDIQEVCFLLTSTAIFKNRKKTQKHSSHTICIYKISFIDIFASIKLPSTEVNFVFVSRVKQFLAIRYKTEKSRKTFPSDNTKNSFQQQSWIR